MRNKHIIDIKTKDGHRVWKLPGPGIDSFQIDSDKISICHGFEHSFSMLSAVIMCLLPLLKSYHIKYLFVDDKELRNVAKIIDVFLPRYCKLPYVQFADEFDKMSEMTKQLNEKDICRDFVYDELIETKYPVLRKMIEIVASLYGQIYDTQRRMRRKMKNGDKIDVLYWRKLKVIKGVFRGYMYKYNPKKEHKIVFDIPYVDHIWNLISIYSEYTYGNRYSRIDFNKKLGCNVCGKKGKRLRICKGCRFACYCSKKCQKYDWTRNKHRAICASLNKSLAIV